MREACVYESNKHIYSIDCCVAVVLSKCVADVEALQFVEPQIVTFNIQ